MHTHVVKKVKEHMNREMTRTHTHTHARAQTEPVPTNHEGAQCREDGRMRPVERAHLPLGCAQRHLRLRTPRARDHTDVVGPGCVRQPSVPGRNIGCRAEGVE